MTSNEYAPDILAFSESQSNQNGRSLFKRTTITKGDPNQEAPFDSLQTIPHAQVEEVLTYSNFPFSNKSQLSIQGTQEDLDKLFALDKSNVQKHIQVYGGSQISQGSLNLNKDPNALPNDGENVYGRNKRGQENGRKSYAQSLDISNIEEKSGIIVESFGDKISQDASDMKIILASNKDTPGPASPIRYGKMSEEAAAMAYEARRKELLDSLAKVTDKKPKKAATPNNISRKNASTDARRSPDQKSPIGNKTFTNFEQKISKVRKAALSKDSNVPPSPHFGRAGPEGSKPKLHQARTREDVAHLITWTPKSTQQSNRRSHSKNSNRSFSNLSSSFRDPEERAAVLTKLLAKDQSAAAAQKEKRLNNAQQAALKGFTFGKDDSGGKDLYMKLTTGNTGNEDSTVAEEQQRDSSPKPIPQQSHLVEVESQEIEGYEGDEQEHDEEQERERERNVFAGTTYQSVYFSSRMKSQGKDVMEDLDALDKEISKMETENKEEEERTSVQKKPIQTKNIVRPQSASLNKNKWSLNNSPIKISENGAEVQSANKRLTPIKEVRNNNVRGQRTASKESEKTAPEQEEEEVVQYDTLNERGYQGHYEYLHARAMVQKKNKDILHKKQQQKKAVAEVEECTFTPKTISSPSRREDIISKTKKWEAGRENKLVKNEMAIIEKEMSACTFYPNNMLETASPGSHTFSNFFQRNTEWRKTKETKNKIREEKVYSSIMTSPKTQNTRETFVTLSNSKDEGTPINYTLPTRSTYLGSPNNNANKPLKTCCEEKLTTLSTFKKDGQKPNVTMQTVSSPSRRQPSAKYNTPVAKKTMTSAKKKEIDGSELKHDIAQSYKLLQQLKDTVKDTTSAKNKFTKKPLAKQSQQLTQQTQPSQQQHHEVDGYDDFDFRLKTSGASFLRDNEGFTEHSQRAISRNSQKFTIESSPQPRTAPRKVPLSSMEFDPAAFQRGEYMITQHNNRYYIQDKKGKKEKNPSSSKVLRTSNSEQNLHSASPINYRPSSRSPDHSILSNRNSYRDSSAKKTKNVTINTDLNLEYYDKGGLTEVRKATNSVGGKNSLKLHYVTNGIVELPQTASLDKKYSELIKKVHDVSGQLKTLGKGVYMSHQI